MPLAGTFDVVSFPDLVAFAAGHRLTGRLVLRVGPVPATLYLRDGRAMGLASSPSGPLEPRDGTWRLRAERLFFEALLTQRGRFDFQPGTLGLPEGAGAGLLELLDAARERVAAWDRARALIPSPDSVICRAEELNSDTLTVDRQQWRALVAIDERRSAIQLARHLGGDLVDLADQLRPLFVSGVLLVEPNPRAFALAPRVRVIADHGG